MGDILVGTCSWTDPTLIESRHFYPDWARSAEGRLQYYASQFPIVEVDSSYYALPNEKTIGLWAIRTGDRFIFDIKAFRLFTRVHHWLIDSKDVGQCLKCDAVRDFRRVTGKSLAKVMEKEWATPATKEARRA